MQRRRGSPLSLKPRAALLLKEKQNAITATSPKDCRRALEKEILSCLQRRKRIKQEYAASVKASQEKIRVVGKKKKPIRIRSHQPKQLRRIRCAFANIRGKEIMERK